MNIEQAFADKSLKAKAKVAVVGEWLLSGELSVEELISFADKQKSAEKATCIEAAEYATKKSPAVADETLIDYVIQTLKDKEPRVKWESAKVIANCIKAFPEKLETAIKTLLANAGHDGTVVRWATATALGEIMKLKSEHNKKLVPKIEAILAKEEDGGVQKKYLDAMKKIKKQSS